jgi:sporulation protein YlmC with PRC-barrel domain
MTKQHPDIDLALAVLDRQIVDREGRKCGRVDDIQLTGTPGSPLTVDALLVGPGAWPGRMRSPIGQLLSRLGHRAETSVPWSDVREISHVVKIQSRAADHSLGLGEEPFRRLMERLPGS